MKWPTSSLRRVHEPREEVNSSLSGTARDVVQAHDVQGGIHFHAPATDRVRPPVPYQLPLAGQGFINRRAEREALDRLLDDGLAYARVLLVTGTAGVGKTSLVLHWSHAVRDRFPDGQLYADLHGYDPQAPVRYERVLESFLRVLGAPADAVHAEGEHMAAAFRSWLAGRRLLIVLDNAASASQVRPLLPATPGCLVIVTSRHRLPGLTIREGAQRLTLDVLDQDGSVALLHSVTRGYRDGDDPEQVAELASLCARLPLALRIAAERAAGRPLMHLEDLIGELRDESGRWEVLSADGDEESEAVRPVFTWSYRALPSDAARLFRLLGLHPGADFSDTAAAALAGVDVRTVRRLLDVVAAAHMVDQTASDRFRLHDLLRAYAADQARLEQTPQECQDALRRVLTWYLHTANAVQARVAPHEPRVELVPADEGLPELLFADEAQAMQWYEAERDNLVAAVRAAASGGLDRIAWQLAVVLRAVYMTNNPFQDWLATSQIGLEAARRDGDRGAEAELQERNPRTTPATRPAASPRNRLPPDPAPAAPEPGSRPGPVRRPRRLPDRPAEECRRAAPRPGHCRTPRPSSEPSPRSPHHRAARPSAPASAPGGAEAATDGRSTLQAAARAAPKRAVARESRKTRQGQVRIRRG